MSKNFPKALIIKKSNVKIASLFRQVRLKYDILSSSDILFGFDFFVFGTEASEDSVCLQMVNVNKSIQIDGPRCNWISQKTTYSSLVLHPLVDQVHYGAVAEPVVIGITDEGVVGLKWEILIGF